MRLRRLYRFDFSEQGVGRHTGHIIMLDTRVEEFSLGLPSMPESSSPPQKPEADHPGETPSSGQGKILPFRRPPRS